MAKKKAKVNIYTHSIDLSHLDIKNAPREKFREILEKIKYKGYEVESISDGRKIVISKPGGKFTYGTIRKEDFMVWIYNPKDSSLWLISHKNIYQELEEKGTINPGETAEIIDALEQVYCGKEPDEVLQEAKLDNPCGELPEVLLKAYKWIWGQEDCNYPDGKGRAMSWEGWGKDKKGDWIKTGTGLRDLRDMLLKSQKKVNS
ncbi:MAG: hypothetical protein ABIG46_05770 [Candidatus Omnitrophota bacterium]|nr:hypothetical protein [Candidatus Omnitrophota bacterium]